jgi:hypothetical protein
MSVLSFRPTGGPFGVIAEGLDSLTVAGDEEKKWDT